MNKLNSIEELKKLRDRLQKEFFESGRLRAHVCCGTACSAAGSYKVVDAFEKEAEKQNVSIEIIKTGCQGLCQNAPVLTIEPLGIFYQKAKPKDAARIISYSSRGVPYRLGLYRDNYWSEPIPLMKEVPFYKKQLKIALRNNGKIDPCNIYHYIAVGGYAALQKVLSSMTPDEVIEEVKKALLRGRGGAGFPAGQKWEYTKKAPGKIKFVIANGDEGDPGAFMDRAIMEGDPYSLLEGMMICAYAIEAQYGLIYVRHEYPLAVRNLRIAIKQAQELGLLGKNILGTDFSFTVDIREGAGAFVCGESTALAASIEGERGFPKVRPPHLSEVGVWGYPTNLNNVETYACIPVIIEKGADYFLSVGTKSSPGTKVFALAGKIKHSGLIEVPMGITLREVIFEIGGGILSDKKFKAVQTGGPSGGCIPAEYLDTPVDFDSLTSLDSMMGSGGMVVMDEDTCMIDVAKFFLSFCQSESCGKCPSCRIGTYQMLEILKRITSGEGQPGDIQKLLQLGEKIIVTALCGLGNTAPNPVLTTIKYFKEEYEEHIYDKYCRAKVCNLGEYIIDQKECIDCGLCKDACALNAVKETSSTYFIDRDCCTKCKACYFACPVNAIKIIKKRHITLEEVFKIPFETIQIIERRTKMKLSDLLEKKPKKIIISIKEDSTILEAIKIMERENVGSILVTDVHNKLVGIFTERDIMHCVARDIPMDKEFIKNVMTRDLLTLDFSTDIGVAITLMSRRGVRHLPVMKGDEIVGVISFRDVVSYLLPEIIYMAEDI